MQEKYIDRYAPSISDEIRKYNDRLKKDCLEPHSVTVTNGYVLPVKPMPNNRPSRGGGGVLTETKEFVSNSADYGNINGESRVFFGGSYDFDESTVNYIEGTFVYLGMAHAHWGHFLLDGIQRLHYFLKKADLSETRYVFAANHTSCRFLKGNIKRFYELFGIDTDRIIIVYKPTKFSTIIVPQPTVKPDSYINAEVYRKIVNRAASTITLPVLSNKNEKIYFSRRRFKKTKTKEVGEWVIEKTFVNIGFEVLYPETLSLEEQIICWSTAKTIACISGTIPHNCVFAQSDLQLIILNKSSEFNSHQLLLDAVQNISPIYVDIHHTLFPRYPLGYGNGPFLYRYTKELHLFLQDKYYVNSMVYQSLLKVIIDTIVYCFLCVKVEIKETMSRSIMIKELRNKIKLTPAMKRENL